jgi:putative tryptophan/tyrosine transport system substrate-binding protein
MRRCDLIVTLGRRELITMLSGASVAWPLLANAEQPDLPVIGFLNGRSAAKGAYVISAFLQGLGDAGYVEGQNVAIEYRWAEDRLERLPDMAADLVRRKVTVIIGGATPSARAAMRATKSIPVVFTTAGDPVKLGLVTDFARPAGNVTGVTFYSSLLAGKRLELIRELLPSATVIGMLVNPQNGLSSELAASDVDQASGALKQQLHIVQASSENDLAAAFAKLADLNAAALLVTVDPFFDSHPARLVALAAERRIPTIYYSSEFVEIGGLMSYGASFTDAYRQAGVYAGRILQGAKPADLPIVQPTKFELAINLETAKALGLVVTPSLLIQADQVIE